MGPDPSIRKTGLIEDRLSSPKDGQDKSHNEVRELHDELACVTRIEVIGSVISPRSKYILYAGYACKLSLDTKVTDITQAGNGDDRLVHTFFHLRIWHGVNHIDAANWTIRR